MLYGARVDSFGGNAMFFYFFFTELFEDSVNRVLEAYLDQYWEAEYKRAVAGLN